MPEVSVKEWDAFFSSFPEAHYHQSSAWGDLKASFGFYEPVHVIAQNAGAQILFPRLPLGIKIGYIPNGPIGSDWQDLWPHIDQACKKRGASFVKVEPDVLEPVNSHILSQMAGFSQVKETIQHRRNIVIDIRGNPDTWIAHMHKSTRKNFHKAIQEGVIVSETDDVGLFYRLFSCTATRRSFVPRPLDYFQKFYDNFIKHNEQKKLHGIMLVAQDHNIPLSAKMILVNGSRAWAIYAGNCEKSIDVKQNCLLHLEGMRWAASQGCTTYDLDGGIPDYDKEFLEANLSRTEGSWGLYRFKRGFGGSVVRTIGAWDRVYNPLMYALYRFYIFASGRYRDEGF